MGDTVIHKGIDGKLVGLHRDPLRVSTLQKIGEIKAASGWVPYSVGAWEPLWVCAAGCGGWSLVSLGLRREFCPTCGRTKHTVAYGRDIHYVSWWRPWTWRRPSIFEWRDTTDQAQIEAIPEPADNGPTTGRLTIVRGDE